MTSTKFSKAAYTKMMLHATKNSTTQIHGILIGTSSSSSINITDAIPICHSAPTKPIVDMGLRLVQASLDKEEIVGWYSGNERAGDNLPSSVSYKLAAQIQALNEKDAAVLVMINSDSFTNMLENHCDESGRDRGFDVYSVTGNKSDVDMPLSTSNVSLAEGDWKSVSGTVAETCLKDGAGVVDFENQLEAGAKGLKNKLQEGDWLRNVHVQ